MTAATRASCAGRAYCRLVDTARDLSQAISRWSWRRAWFHRVRAARAGHRSPLVGIAWVAYLMLWGLTAARIVLFPTASPRIVEPPARAGLLHAGGEHCVLGTQTAVAGAQGLRPCSGIRARALVPRDVRLLHRGHDPRASHAGRRDQRRLVDRGGATQSIVVLKGTPGALPPPEVQFLCLASS